MSKPQSREEFAAFVLRELGAPVIKINVSEAQVDDAIDQALYLYGQYHMDGSEKTYYKYSMTSADIANQYITLPSNILGAVKIFPIGNALNTNSLFNMRYQFVINDLYNISNVSMIPYYMVMNHVQFLEQMLVGDQPVRFNRHNNILYLDMDMSTVTEGEWLVVEAYMVVDPNTYSDVWSDWWLQQYTVALIKKRWASILKKINLPLMGGANIDGKSLYIEAMQELKDLKHELVHTYSIPAGMLIG